MSLIFHFTLLALIGAMAASYIGDKKAEIRNLKAKIRDMQYYLNQANRASAAEHNALAELGIIYNAEQSMFWNKHTGQKAAIRDNSSS